jgi:hypothetical protein
MTQPSSIVKELSSGRGDRRIRVLIAEGNGFSATTFSEAEIERVMDIGEERSALVLRSGVKIPVALSYEQLEQQIYERDFCTDGPVLDRLDVTGCAASKPSSGASIGDKMPAGTVYAGISPETGKSMYATPADAPLTMKFNAAKDYPQGLNAQKAHGHEDWQVPTKNELNVLFNNRAAIGGFDMSGSDPSRWYWSSSSFNIWLAWGQRFSDGYQDYYNKYNPSSVRCVR